MDSQSSIVSFMFEVTLKGICLVGPTARENKASAY